MNEDQLSESIKLYEDQVDSEILTKNSNPISYIIWLWTREEGFVLYATI